MPTETNTALITDDIVVFGILMGILGLVHYTSNLNNTFVKKFYNVLPPLLLCYFLPGLLNSFDIISGEHSNINTISSNYFLPGCLILFTLNLNLKELWKMRKNAGIMFIAGMIGIVLGGPLAVWIMSWIAPEVVAGETWKGLATLAGSWVGGSANQAALYAIFQPSADLYSSMIAVDVFVAYGWMALLMYGAGKEKSINKFLGADNSDVEALTVRMDNQMKDKARNPETKDLFIMMGITFSCIALAQLISGNIAKYIEVNMPQLAQFSLTSKFFWLIMITTIIGILLSFTKARNYEGAGASKFATVFLYILIASIGMNMNIFSILSNPMLFLVGIIWMSFHALILLITAKILKSPFFFYAVSSMANVGGVASASATAAAFHPALISVGVILAIFGYAIGTYTGYICGILMQLVAPQ